MLALKGLTYPPCAKIFKIQEKVFSSTSIE